MVARLRRFGPGLLVMLLAAACGAPESDPSGLAASSDSAVPATDPIPSTAAATRGSPYPEPTADLQQPGCRSDSSPKFTHPFTDLSKINFISPIGVVTHSVVPHSYVWIGRDSDGEPYEVPVYAPVDSKLTSAAYYVQPMQDESGDWIEVPQYLLRFAVSCEVTYKFDHLDRLVDKLAAVAPAPPSASSHTSEIRPPVALKAGELIGYTSGTIVAHNWDFGVYNASNSNPFVNQARYETTANLAGSLYADCPYDYFQDALRKQFYALLPNEDCGSASRDELGTIAGTWFAERNLNPVRVGPKLVIGRTWVLGGEFVVIRGESAEIRVFPGQKTFADPAEITTQHCYQTSQGPPRFVYLELRSELELAVAFGEGTCPTELPGDHDPYYR